MAVLNLRTFNRRAFFWNFFFGFLYFLPICSEDLPGNFSARIGPKRSSEAHESKTIFLRIVKLPFFCLLNTHCF